MSWVRFILLVFVGFTLDDTRALENDRRRGAEIGYLKTLQHQVTGRVWAVDEDKLYIENFTFDGLSQDTFFWIGNGSQPNPKGHLIRYPLSSADDKEVALEAMENKNILLHLPPNLKITDMNWFSVWCRRFTVDNGHVIIPPNLEPPRKRVLPEFQRLAHDLRSGNITILDARTFYIPNLHYDGLGPDAFFWVGNGTKPDPKGQKIPNEMGSLEILRNYEGEDIELQLPENMTVYDIDYLGVWCVTYKHNFGHVQIPRAEDLWVPPALGQTRIKPEEVIEAYSKDVRDIYETSLGEGQMSNPHQTPSSASSSPSTDFASGLPPQAGSNHGFGPDSKSNMSGASSSHHNHHLIPYLILPALFLAALSGPLSLASRFFTL